MRNLTEYNYMNGSVTLFFCCKGKMEDNAEQPCNPTDIYNFQDVDMVTSNDTDDPYRTIKGSWATLLPDTRECVRVS